MPKTLGIRHIALRVNHLEECIDFYQRVLQMRLELRTDKYAYFSSGDDNLSLHQDDELTFSSQQRLEHFGFSCQSPSDVDEWYEHCKKYPIKIDGEPVTFGIGTRGFSIFDPSGTEIEFTYHPPMVQS